MNKLEITTLLLIGSMFIILPFFHLSLGNQTDVIYTMPVISLLSLILFVLKSRRLKVRCQDLWMSGFMLYGGLNICFVRENIGDEIIVFQWLTVLTLYFLLRQTKKNALLLYIILLSCSLQSGIAILQYVGLIESYNHNFAVTGMFYNPGVLGGYLAMGFCISILLICYKVGNIYIHILMLVLIVCGLLLSNARTAWLASLVGAAIILYRRYNIKINLVGKCVLTLCLLVVCIAGYYYKKDSADGRFLLWRISVNMFQDKPIFGHGVGIFKEQALYYQGDYFSAHNDSVFVMRADNPRYVYNEFLHTAVELGLLGVLLLVGLLCSVLKSCKKRALPLLLYPCIVLMCFSYPSDVFPLLILFPLLVAAGRSRILYKIDLKLIRYIPMAGSLLLGIYGICVLMRYGRIENNIRQGQWDSVYEEMKYNATFMDIYAQKAFLDKDVMQSIAIMEQCKQVMPTCELLCDLSVRYKYIGLLDKAETYLKMASDAIPYRLRPKYELFKLYKEKDSILARKVAEQILLQPLKVKNTYSMQVRGEVRRYIEGKK